MMPGHALNNAAGGATLPQQWLNLVGAFGERPAFRKKSRGVWHTLTWREWHAQVCALVRNWHGRGIGRELRHLEADQDVALSPEVVDLVRSDRVDGAGT